MTYEDLLSDIDSEQFRNSRTLDTPYAALRAVLELHKPATATSFTNNDCICMLPNKKCATIMVIERELA